MVEAHTTDVLTDSIVRVNGTRIPVGDVDVFMRNEGPLDFTRYAEGEFPSPFKGVDYADASSGFDPTNQDEWDTVTIDVKDHVTEDYYRAFTGVVTGVGNAESGGDKWFKFRAQGPGHFLDKIPVQYSANNVSIENFFGYIEDRLNEKLPFPVTTSVPSGAVRDGVIVKASDKNWDITQPIEELIAGALGGVSGKMHTPRNFNFGKDTVADMISWVSGKINAYLWLSPTDDGIVFIATRNLDGNEHRAQYLGGDLQIENNDALSELRPVNTMLVKAPAKDSRDGEDKKASKKYVKAKAVHEPLYRRAGNTYLYADVHNISGAKTKVETQSEAKNQLKEAINQTTAGDMQTWLRGPITPFDTVEAKPTCGGSEATNLDSITYEVTRVHHKVRASKPSSTVLNVGVHTDPDEDIVVEDGWEDA